MNLILSKVFRILFILYLFTILNDGGYVAVRKDNGETVHTDVCVSMLPPQDAVLLDRGIVCDNVTELAGVLENYIS